MCGNLEYLSDSYYYIKLWLRWIAPRQTRTVPRLPMCPSSAYGSGSLDFPSLVRYTKASVPNPSILIMLTSPPKYLA